MGQKNSKDVSYQEAVLDTYRPQHGRCFARECANILNVIQTSRHDVGVTLDYCWTWDQFVCGAYMPHRPGESQYPSITESIADALFDTVRTTVDTSYKFISVLHDAEDSAAKSRGNVTKAVPIVPDINIHLWDLVGRYFNTCMNELGPKSDNVLLDLMGEVNRAFEPLDDMYLATQGKQVKTYRPTFNVSDTVEGDEEGLTFTAMANLARFGIFPLFRFGVAESPNDPRTKRPLITPGFRLGLKDTTLYQFNYVKLQYTDVLKDILPRLYGHHATRIPDMEWLPYQIYAMERAFVESRLAADRVKWGVLESHIRVRPITALANYGLDKLITSMLEDGTEPVNLVDLMLDGDIPKYWDVMKKATRETMRAYLMFQTFLQTLDLWDMDWVQRWRDFADYHLDTRPPTPERYQICVGRVQRHFGHLVSARLMKYKFPEKDGESPYITIGHIKAQMGYKSGCPHAITNQKLAEIYEGVDVRTHKPDNSLWEEHGPKKINNISRPETWMHLHDYFALEKHHWRRSWLQNGRPSNEEKCTELGLAFSVTNE